MPKVIDGEAELRRLESQLGLARSVITDPFQLARRLDELDQRLADRRRIERERSLPRPIDPYTGTVLPWGAFYKHDPAELGRIEPSR